MTFIFPKPSSETSDSLDDDDSAASVDKFLGQSRQDIERVLSRSKSFNNEASNDIVSSAMDTAEVDEEIQDLNTVLGNGNEDFDFRTLNKEELITMLRGEPTRETYSNIGNMSKFMHPELARTDREAKKQEAKKFKTSQVCDVMLRTHLGFPHPVFVFDFVLSLCYCVVLCCLPARPHT